MRLMKRERQSLIAVPVNHTGFNDFPGLADQPGDQALSRIIKGMPDDIISGVLTREKLELEAQFNAEKDQPEAIFIKEALNLLEERMNQCVELSMMMGPLTPVTPLVSPTNSELAQPFPNVEKIGLARGENCIAVAEDPFNQDASEAECRAAGEENAANACIEGAEKDSDQDVPNLVIGQDDSIPAAEECIAAAENSLTAADCLDLANLTIQSCGKTQQAPKTTFFFYQDSNGQLIFMHALNVQMLVHQFGSFDNCPQTISAKILEKDCFIMSVELRDRLRYLRHLPVSSSFEVAELDISSIVSAETVNFFKDQLDNRRKERQRKQKAEKIREKKIKRDEMRIMGRFPSPMARIDSAYHYPSMSGADDSAMPVHSLSEVDNASWPTANAALDVAVAAANTASAAPAATASDSAAAAGLNFARIAKRPVHVNSTPAPPQQTTKSSGMVQLGGALPLARIRQQSESDVDPEGYVPPPPVASLGDALAQAIANADTKQSSKKKGKRSRGQAICLTGGGSAGARPR